MKVKEESERVGLKLNIQKTKIMASSPITSWETDGETAETMSDFIFLGSKITADGECSHEIKRCLLFGRKVMTNLDMAQRLKRLPAIWETWVQSLGQEDRLEKEIATHSGIFAWEILWTEEPEGLLSMGSQELDTT